VDWTASKEKQCRIQNCTRLYIHITHTDCLFLLSCFVGHALLLRFIRPSKCEKHSVCCVLRKFHRVAGGGPTHTNRRHAFLHILASAACVLKISSAGAAVTPLAERATRHISSVKQRADVIPFYSACNVTITTVVL
jgi:hypothetical protein